MARTMCQNFEKYSQTDPFSSLERNTSRALLSSSSRTNSFRMEATKLSHVVGLAPALKIVYPQIGAVLMNRVVA